MHIYTCFTFHMHKTLAGCYYKSVVKFCFIFLLRAMIGFFKWIFLSWCIKIRKDLFLSTELFLKTMLLNYHNPQIQIPENRTKKFEFVFCELLWELSKLSHQHFFTLVGINPNIFPAFSSSDKLAFWCVKPLEINVCEGV